MERDGGGGGLERALGGFWGTFEVSLKLALFSDTLWEASWGVFWGLVGRLGGLGIFLGAS